jgi:hypothetical protein
MIERFVAPALTFTVLIAGHVAIASAMFASPGVSPADQAAKLPVIQLEAVLITAKRSS